MPRKKPFIDKKHATTYRLIPGYVPDTIEEDDVLKTDEEIDKRKKEQREYGIFYGDNYNYMQHLRSLTEKASMVKVSDLSNTEDELRSTFGGSSVNFRIFSSEAKPKEENIDPDILASLEEAPEVKMTGDGEIENDDVDFLDDDFINKAGGYVTKPEKDEDYDGDHGFDDEQDLGSDFDGYSDNDFDYQEDDDFDDTADIHQIESRGNLQDDIVEAQTALILKNFEEGLGFSTVAQDMDEDDGRATTEDYEHLKEILMQDKLKQNKMMTSEQFLNDHASRPDFDYSKYDKEDAVEEEFEWKEVAPSKPQFDCVSILSLNSNTRNLPTDIIPPSSEKRRLKKCSTSEAEPSITQGLSRSELEEEMRLSRRADKASTFRPVGETREERVLRKKAIKEERKERRQEKKANQIVFSMEKKKMDQEFASLSKSAKGIKLS